MPITVTFGAACIFWASYVNDETVDTYMSTDDVGYLGSLLTGVVALCAIPAATFSTAYGKMWVLALGSLAYFLLSGAYVVWTNEELGHWSSMAPLAILYSMGHLTYENSAKAIYADMFPNKRATAFASLNFISGFSSSIFAFMLAGGLDNGTLKLKSASILKNHCALLCMCLLRRMVLCVRFIPILVFIFLCRRSCSWSL